MAAAIGAVEEQACYTEVDRTVRTGPAVFQTEAVVRTEVVVEHSRMAGTPAVPTVRAVAAALVQNQAATV